MDIVVVGAGSWGTALACVLCENQHRVTLWGRDAEHMELMQSTRENRRYLPGLTLPPSLRCSSDLHGAIAALPKDETSLVVAVVPTHTMRQVFLQIATEIPPLAIVVSASKGIENETLLTMDEVLKQVLPTALHERIAALSGPSFARETIEKHPTAVVAAASQRRIAEEVQRAFQCGNFRVYTSDDVVGAEIGGAVKNVIAIACGIADGLGFGHNTRAAAITRGLAEITRLGVRLGCNPMTLAGLAGMGDLVLTCNGPQSRNRQAGLLFASGKNLTQVQAEMKQVAEGIRTVRSVHDLAQKVSVEMPISAAMYRVLYENQPVGKVMSELLGRPPRHELY
ncbi:MAG TPA: NAD(P)H-dependent glycerol-3-phosphate dehydrogenase [Pseudomonadota bacterium]|nr:NAD(P)H-dependent glycerol-3-phosphate dehydrogenase [Pseudomonadota bacterium]